MAITQRDLGGRIRAAREACHLTQAQVAERLGVSRPAVVQIEGGNRVVSSLELGKLAYLLGRDLSEFLSDSFEKEDTLAALFRAQPAVAEQPGVLEKIRECMALGREITNLERCLDISRGAAGMATYALPAPRTRWEAVSQGQRLSEEERRRLCLGNAPLPCLTELLESQGTRTGLVDLPEDVSGLTLIDRQTGPFIVANRKHHHLRRRFSFAHEYAHVLGDRDRFGLVSRTSERDNLVEVRANAFAAEFLMPEAGVEDFIAGLGKGMASRSSTDLYDEAGTVNVEGRTESGSQLVQLYDIVRLAHHFGVSRLAALYRLRNLRLLTEAQFEHLRALDDAGRGRQIADLLGLPEPNHMEVRDEFRRRFISLALEAYRREEISRGKLQELALMVEVTLEDLGCLVEEAGLNESPRDSEIGS